MSKIELLSPVGDFDCLKAAVQSGADSVYLGGELFNARASASNFDKEGLREAIRYAKLRNVKVNFTLNTLLKDNEIEEASELAKYVYSLGVDAILVQDLGLAKYLIDNFPNMDIHASTQMSAHNLHGVLELERLGFKRVVLARELSLHEIEYICEHSNIEIETFIHGALCISYSGQCLFSSLVGGRSGNRGKCAQACRLPYELTQEDTEKVVDKGYLLSPKDLCGLKYIPDLIKAGVKCLKIEGRMKTPEYVATVTRIYRKYIDMAEKNEPYIIDENDVKELMQVFNRGGFSNGNLDNEPNEDYVYPKKSNNIGILLGQISNYNPSKGLVTFNTREEISLHDTVCVENEEHKYTVSELMIEKENIKKANSGTKVTIGRIKGNISISDKIYKLSDYAKCKQIYEYINKENKKIPLSCTITVKKGMPITMEVNSLDKEDGSYFSMSTTKSIDLIPIDSISNPINKERIIEQIKKTTNTPFEFKKIIIILDDDTYIPKISAINSLRRDCLDDLIKQAISRFERKEEIISFNEYYHKNLIDDFEDDSKEAYLKNTQINPKKKVFYSLLLNKIYTDYDYSKLQNIDKIYVPIRYFLSKRFVDILNILKTKGNLYICAPTILKDNYRNITFNRLDEFIETYNIKGIVINNISRADNIIQSDRNIEIVGNYTLNIFNEFTINVLKNLGVNVATLSPELDKATLQKLALQSTLPTELTVYGRIPLMNIGYCFLGKSNRCYPTCETICKQNKYYLKDRRGYKFKIHQDNVQTITTVYNSKILSIPFDDINIDVARISIYDETIDEINNIINTVRAGNIFTGEDYTFGNFNRLV